MSFAIDIRTAVASQMMDVKYPQYLWRKVINPDQRLTGIDPGAVNFAQPVRDTRGAAAFQAALPGDNVPTVGMSINNILTPLAVSNSSYVISDEDARQYRHAHRTSIVSDLSKAMRRAFENLTEASFFWGDPNVSFQPWLDYPDLPTSMVAVGAGGSTLWANKTGLEIVTDVQEAMLGMWTGSNTLFMPNRIFLPPKQYGIIQGTVLAIGNSPIAVSALKYLKENNIYTDQTGEPLEVIPIRYLVGSGSGGTDRMALQDTNREYQVVPFPLDVYFKPPIPTKRGAETVGEMKHGSLQVYQQGSLVYFDGI